MAINGRINVDVLFHDTDGTTSLKVVSLEDSTEYTSGKVAIVTGTCGTASVVLNVENGFGYRDASGNQVTFSNVSRFAFSASGNQFVRCQADESVFPTVKSQLLSKNDLVAVGPCGEDEEFSVQVLGTAGTASYTLVLYGT